MHGDPATGGDFLAPPSSAEEPFAYGRTSALRDHEQAAPQLLVFPSRRPAYSRAPYSDTPSLASSTASQVQQGYLPPPGLTSPSSTSLQRKSAKPRSARVDYHPPLPAAAQWLLLTTPPPPPRMRASSLVSNVESITSITPTAAPPSKKSWGKKSLAALGLRGSNLSAAPGPGRSRKGSGASLRPEPAKVQLQLGGGVVKPRVSTSSMTRRGGRLDARSEEYEIPRSWDEYGERYGLGDVNIEDPPFPPIHLTSLGATSARPSPYQEGSFPAPVSPLEPIRQKLLAQLDLLGKGSSADSTAYPPIANSAAMLRQSSASSSSRFADSPKPDSLFTNANNRDSMVSTAPSSAAASPNMAFPSRLSMASRSFQSHPSLLAILAKSRALFGTKVTLITILEEHRQFFLASEGMPDKVESLPRSATICSHTVLNGERGLVVLDTQRDWRFRGNMLAVVLGARFYAGMPIFGPSNPELEEEAGGRLPIGTIAILDDACRTDFSPAERAKLRSLATDVSNELQSWVSAHQQLQQHQHQQQQVIPAPAPSARRRSSISSLSSTTNRLKHISFESSSSYIDWQATAATTATAKRVTRGSKGKDREGDGLEMPMTPPGSIRRCSRREEEVMGGLAPPIALGTAGRGLSPMPEESPAPTPNPIVRRTSISDHTPPPPSSRTEEQHCTFPSAPRPRRAPSSTASANIAEPTPKSKPKSIFPSAHRRPPPPSLNLQLPPTPQQKLFDAATTALGSGLNLSLVYLVELNLSSSHSPTLTLLSAYNLPATRPQFDPALHVRALRAPEGGLLFKNPLCSTEGVEWEGPGFASGILLPVHESEGGGGGGKGWVLAGYTRDAGREFEEDELGYFVRVAEECRKVVLWGVGDRRGSEE